MKLYFSPGACSLAPHILLEEIGEPYDLELVSTMDGSTRKESYLSINPKGRVPVLEVDGEIITEVTAIMLYLAQTFPEAKVVSESPVGLAHAVEWFNWATGIHASVIAQNWRTERFSDDVSAHAGIQKKGMENLRNFCLQVDAKLEGSHWATGDSYSIADPYLLVFFRWGNRLGLDMKEFKNWSRQAKQMEQRSAVQSVLKTEGISIWE